ncbi:MAG: hypothetical protein HYZ45_10160 [Burkholderiales bacterium]|nr:hypothetical protein [Burkholderiales bacterium]
MLCQPALATGNKFDIVYPSPESPTDTRYLYDWEVLRLALERTSARFGPYEIHPSSEYMAPARVTQEMMLANGRVNLFVRATSRELEQKLRPIRIPVDRGLLGYRIFLVRKNDLPQFAHITDLAQLRPLRAGQGRGWADIAILQASGLNVVEGNNYEGLFGMLQMNRFDYFSRSADEALREYSERHESIPELAVEPTLLLYYPLPRYFFVRRDSEGELLAQRIEAGLEMMVRDGSMQALFWKHKGGLIERAGLTKRRMFKIDNPTLSPETPLHRPELWFQPGK